MIPVTVCIAAICDTSMLLGMSDRMLTAGDIQFQPPSSKIWEITKSIVMMAAGDVGLQTEIWTQVRKSVDVRIQEKPNDWFRVEEVADLYRAAYFNLKRRRAEMEILAPLGLDSTSFLTQQKSMDAELVSKIAQELISYRMPDVAAIIAGNNPLHGAPKGSAVVSGHLFVVENGDVSCADKVGFACVGAGAWHANSAMMQTGHTPATSIPNALLNIYTAKRRAEVAPGVGIETDNFIITSALGGYSDLKDDVMAAIGNAYTEYSKENELARKKAENSLNEYIAEITKPKEPATPQTTH